MMKVLLGILISIFLLPHCKGEAIIHRVGVVLASGKGAIRRGKPILLFFRSPWYLT